METKFLKYQPDQYATIVDFIVDGKHIYFLAGGRNSGKSYSVANYIYNKMVENPQYQFIYTRATREEISTVDTWFDDLPLEKLVHGETYKIVRGKPHARAIQLIGTQLTENKVGSIIEEETDRRHIGYAFSLESSKLMKSGKYPHVKDIVFEEYASKDLTIKEEKQAAFNLFEMIETSFRLDNNVNLFCITNIFNRIPYLEYLYSNSSKSIKYNIIKKRDNVNGLLAELPKEYVKYLEGEAFQEEKINIKDYICIDKFNINKENKTIWILVNRYDTKKFYFTDKKQQETYNLKITPTIYLTMLRNNKVDMNFNSRETNNLLTRNYNILEEHLKKKVGLLAIL
jgi:hypothetical protein